MTVETFQNPCFYTSGDWADEPEAMADFDNRLKIINANNDGGLFAVYSEVFGYQSQPRLGADGKEHLRIDRLLIPTPTFRKRGWKYGAVGIEGKAPRTKIGPVVAQTLDYGRTVWEPMPGMHIMCPWVFIWQLQEFAGDIASVMAQHRIGGAFFTSYEPLVLKSSCGALLRVQRNYMPEIKEVRAGMKAGSR